MKGSDRPGGRIKDFTSSCSVSSDAEDSVGVSRGVLSLRISVLNSFSLSYVSLSFSFRCHGSSHVSFQWLSFHDHCDMSNAGRKNPNCVCHFVKKKKLPPGGTGQSAAVRSLTPKTFILALEEGVPNATSGPSVDDVSQTHQPAHKRRWALSNALFPSLPRLTCALTQQFSRIIVGRVRVFVPRFGSSHLSPTFLFFNCPDPAENLGVRRTRGATAL